MSLKGLISDLLNDKFVPDKSSLLFAVQSSLDASQNEREWQYHDTKR